MFVIFQMHMGKLQHGDPFIFFKPLSFLGKWLDRGFLFDIKKLLSAYMPALEGGAVGNQKMFDDGLVERGQIMENPCSATGHR